MVGLVVVGVCVLFFLVLLSLVVLVCLLASVLLFVCCVCLGSWPVYVTYYDRCVGSYCWSECCRDCVVLALVRVVVVRMVLPP